MQIALFLAVVMFFAASWRAEARGDGSDFDEGPLIAAASVVLMTDFAFAVHDMVGDRSVEVGFLEVLVVGPQAVGAIYLMADQGEAPLGGILFAAVTTAMTVHGVYSMVSPTLERAVEKPRVTLAPTVVSDGRDVGPGLGLGGHF